MLKYSLHIFLFRMAHKKGTKFNKSTLSESHRQMKIDDAAVRPQKKRLNEGSIRKKSAQIRDKKNERTNENLISRLVKSGCTDVNYFEWGTKLS